MVFNGVLIQMKFNNNTIPPITDIMILVIHLLKLQQRQGPLGAAGA